MRKTVLTTIAGAARRQRLAAAQMESSPGRKNGAQGASQREPGRGCTNANPVHASPGPGAVPGWW
jgi:hypothetical protein